MTAIESERSIRLVTEVPGPRSKEIVARREAATPPGAAKLTQIAVERAESELEKAQQQLAAGDAGVVAARAGLDAALANQDKSAKDFERLNRLYEQDPGTISQRRLEMSKASLEASTA